MPTVLRVVGSRHADVCVPRALARSKHLVHLFPDDLPGQSSFIFHLIALLYKKIYIPQVLFWRDADKFGLTAHMEPFLTNVLRDDSTLELFLCHRWRRALARWADIPVYTFHLGGVSRSCTLIELWRHLGIYTAKETLSPHFHAGLDSCITEPPHQYHYMQVWGHARGAYVSRTAKESAFRSPIYRLIHWLVTSTIYHRKECEKVPSGHLFYIWCLTQTEVFLHPPFSLALYLSGMALGSMPSSRIYGGHWVTRLVLSYEHICMDHPPFRHMGPVIPPHAQPGHDGVGPLSTHHRDTDDDDDSNEGG
ncbi:unnamed protein product [Lactuca saligna]|uniref:Uncharacterized protein n=1 Tax=Lactuca saligna TaxID=75948 RepID=A0AA36E7D5_LACSI|nr:unnamed protein product [Lactuca saligna]